MLPRAHLLPALMIGLLPLAPAEAQYALQVQGGYSLHGTGDLPGQEMRVALGYRLGRVGDLKLGYQHSSFSAEYTWSELDDRGGFDDLEIGPDGIEAGGAHDEYARVSAATVGLSRDTRIIGGLHFYAGLAGGIYHVRRKTFASFRVIEDGSGRREVDLGYIAESFVAPLLSVDLGLAFELDGLTIGPYASGHFAGRGDRMTGVGLFARLDWPVQID